MSIPDDTYECLREKDEICRLKEERSLKKICRVGKPIKASSDEKSKGFKGLVSSHSNCSTYKRRNSTASITSQIKSKITSKISDNSRGSGGKKKLYLENEKKVSEYRTPYKPNPKSKKNKIIKLEKKKIVVNTNSKNFFPRSKTHSQSSISNAEGATSKKINIQSQNHKESNLVIIQNKGYFGHKSCEPYQSPRETPAPKEKAISKRVRFADNLQKSNQYPVESHSMSSILISETDKWVNPGLSPPKLTVSDFVMEFGMKISGGQSSHPKTEEKNDKNKNDKLRIYPIEKMSIPKLNKNSISSQIT